MPRPKTKIELLTQSKNNYEKLIQLISSYSKDELNQEFPEGTLNRNIKDVLLHLHEWHLLMLEWYKVGMRGDKPEMPEKGYTWKTLPKLNLEIWKRNKNVEPQVAKKLLDRSYKLTQEMIKKHSEEELFTKNKYKWTGSTSLGEYLISNTSSHYNWAFKLIRRSIK